MLTRSTSERNLEGLNVTVGAAPHTLGHVSSNQRTRCNSGHASPHLNDQASWKHITLSPAVATLDASALELGATASRTSSQSPLLLEGAVPDAPAKKLSYATRFPQVPGRDRTLQLANGMPHLSQW